jgi:uncharacterized membrane protein
MIWKNHGTPTWRRMGMSVSVVLNLFLIALIAGHLWQVRRYEALSGAPLNRVLAEAEARLPPQDAAAFSAVVKRDTPQFTTAAQELADARLELGRQLTAEKFDQQATRQAFVVWRAAWNRFLGRFESTLVEALAQVSPEGRRELVKGRRAANLEPPANKSAN